MGYKVEPVEVEEFWKFGGYWAYIGVILGSYWGYIGLILGLYWGCIGVILGLGTVSKTRPSLQYAGRERKDTQALNPKPQILNG